MKYYYLDGRLVPSGRAVVRPMTHALNYGTAAMEGMRALWDKKDKTWYLFRPERHLARLQRGTAMLDIDWDMTCERFVSSLERLIVKNDQREDLYLRPLVYHASETVGLTRTGKHQFVVYAQPMPLKKGPTRSAGMVGQRRPVDGSYAVKIAGNYVLSYLAQAEARQQGHDVGVMLSTEGYLSEAAVMNLFWVKGGALFTPSLNCGPLPGITRDCVIRIARDRLGVEVREGKYRAAVLNSADEIFLCGTGTAIARINRFERRKLRSRKNSLADWIWSEYRRILRNRPGEYADWFYAVEI
ncbi:hypothetical protein GF377_00275 [candidate division GN15 bacterium]|nr:hypothetical protein [candidate division GN15 bacterium]